tara:strand:- start:3620 stop:4078 length:459 start_codon:yes stop_codon:yes gene_type:complete
MTTQVQFRRGTTAEHAFFTGADGELTIDTDKNMAVIHDGSTAGGFDVQRSRWESITSDTLLGTNLKYLVDSSGGPIQLTLPSYNNQLIPRSGDTVEFVDSAFTWDINNITLVDTNGRKFINENNVVSSPLIFDVRGARVQLIWEGVYWRVVV